MEWATDNRLHDVRGVLFYFVWHWPLLQLLRPSSSAEVCLFFVLLILVAWLGFIFLERPAREGLKAKFRRSALQLSAT
jgi:peptidoglycan/LPS O-acetylase OafA/YrhL